MVAELLVGGGVADLVAEMGAVGLDDEGVVVVVGGLLAGDVLLGDADGEAHGLAAPLHGVGRGIVGAPAGAQALVVAELLGALDVDDAGGEEVVAHVAVEVDVDVGVAVAGILGVAEGHVEGCRVFLRPVGSKRAELERGDGCWVLGVGELPAAVDDLDDDAQGTVANDALGARADGVDHRGLLAVPAAEGTEAEGVAHPQHVVAIALSFLFGRGVELRLLQLQALLELAVEVERLALVEVDAYAVELALEVDTVVVLQVVGVGAVAARRDALDVVVVTVLLLHLVVTHEHLGIDARLVLTGLALAVEGHRVAALLARLQVDEEAELVVDVVLVEVVELAGHLLAIAGDESRAYVAVAAKADDHGLVGAVGLQGVAHFYADGGLCGRRECHEGGGEDGKLSFHCRFSI